MKRWLKTISWMGFILIGVVACSGGDSEGIETETAVTATIPATATNVAQIINRVDPESRDTEGEESDPSTNSETANQEPAAKGVVGLYNISGTNLNGTEYRGTLNITRENSAYRLYWEAVNTFDGLGLVTDNVLSAGWGSPTCTVVAYRQLPDGTLEGEWVVANQAGIGTETAVPTDNVEPGGLLGTYTVVGTNPGSSQPYQGTLSVTNLGNVYSFVWDAGGYFEGIGIQRGNVISVGWGPQQNCSAVSYTIEPNGNLNGTWGIFGQTGLGTEEAVR